MVTTPPRSPLLHNLVFFGRLLRAVGVRVTSQQLVELVNTLSYIEIGNRADFKNTARCLLVHRHEDIPVFDHAFDVFWRVWRDRQRETPIDDLVREVVASRPAVPLDRSPTGTAHTQRKGAVSLARNGASGEDAGLEEGERLLVTVYSASEALRHKDFSLFDANELRDARRFLEEMRWTIVRRRALRTRPSRRGKQLDVRRTLRRSTRHGGEMLDLARRGPKQKRRQLVLLCDISGSMERYTRLFLHFLHSVEASVQRAEVFVFGTRLTRITQELKRRDPDVAIAAVTAQVQDWSGGTRIGEALHTFNARWARRVLGHGAIVLIISDGWDRGDPALLEREMGRLRRQSYRLIWLNPLLGSLDYQPVTQGMQAALPYVDDFLPVHNLRSLEDLAALLNDVQEGRPDRRQIHH